ncbi:C40 family peptidase [Streptomyces sp. HPF1205]|uniref:C40 family peptidase n=1 Tax=Streptomyces sp. HPF1205 TaxID=2873262 RepID=UPI0021F1BCC8|nr:C40 family peptidase [Streptomyces sp. HPF1205]
MSVDRRSRPSARWLRSAVVCGTLLAAAALSVPGAQLAAARPYDPPAAAPVPLGDLLKQLQALYTQTESATESYDRARENADTLRKRAASIDAQLAAQRVKLAAGRDEAGLMARQMYQDGGVSPYLSLLGGQTPEDFFGQRHIIERVAGHEKDIVARLAEGEARLSVLNAQAQRALDRAQHAQTVQQAQKTRVQNRLKAVESMLAGLTGAQIDELQALEEKGVNQAQQDFLDSKALGDGWQTRAPSAAGDKAIAYAFMQLGKPYEWGAQGPDAFDCSGLTSQAWLHAGVPIPRTSQEQWARLPHVPLSQLRPGDLVVYFAGASHVALYIGDGLVIQAPRPGSYVKVSPVAANPVLGAVRPDMGASAMTGWTPRSVPAAARKPTPIASEDLTAPVASGGHAAPARPSAPPARPPASSSPSPRPTATPTGSSSTPAPSPSGSGTPAPTGTPTSGASATPTSTGTDGTPAPGQP